MVSLIEIQKTLSNLDAENFGVHYLDDAWYSPKAMIRALGGEHQELEMVPCIRVRLAHGMLELHPEDDSVRVRCYCFFDGNSERGTVPLNQLEELVRSLKEHDCPPWPG